MQDHVIWPERYDPKTSVIYADGEKRLPERDLRGDVRGPGLVDPPR